MSSKTQSFLWRGITERSVVPRFAFLLLAALLMAACSSDPTPQPTPTVVAQVPTIRPQATVTAIPAGRFGVVLAYRLQATYAEKMLGSDEESRWNPYFQQVIRPIASFFDDFPQPDEMRAHWAVEGAAIEPQQLIDLGKQADGAQLGEVVSGTLVALERDLPGNPAQVYVFAGLPTLADGVGATSPGADRLALVFNTDTLATGDEAAAQWRRWLPYHLYREEYAAQRTKASGASDKLLDTAIRYGLADLFAGKAYPELSPPWLRAVSAAQEHTIWQEMKTLLDTTEQFQLDRFIGGSAGGTIPPYSAFTIGYHIVTAYVAAHPGSDALSLLATPAQVILDGSGYNP